MSWFSSSKGYESDEFEESATPFWETAVVSLSDGERRKPNYYEGLIPLWPHLGQLMVRDDFEKRRWCDDTVDFGSDCARRERDNDAR